MLEISTHPVSNSSRQHYSIQQGKQPRVKSADATQRRLRQIGKFIEATAVPNLEVPVSKNQNHYPQSMMLTLQPYKVDPLEP